MKSFRYIIANRNGITLVELLAGMAIMTLLMSVTLTTLATSITIWQTGKTRSEIEHAARYALDVIVREIRYANRLELKSKSALMIVRPNGERVTYQYGSSQSKIIYKVTDNSATGGGRATNPLTPAVIDGLSFDIDSNEVKILIQATSYRGEKLEYSTTVSSLNIDISSIRQ